MAVLTQVQASAAGVAVGPTTAAAAGQQFSAGDRVYLLIKNADGSSHTATIDDPNTPSPVGATAFNPDDAIVVAAGTTVLAGPFPAQRFGDVNGLASIAWSATTSMTVQVINL